MRQRYRAAEEQLGTTTLDLERANRRGEARQAKFGMIAGEDPWSGPGKLKFGMSAGEDPWSGPGKLRLV